MQMIEAVIKPHKLDAVKGALTKIGIRGARMDVGFVPKVLLKVCVKASDVEKALTAIVESARTGEVGDGKVFVYPIAKTVRIRTGEQDENAL